MCGSVSNSENMYDYNLYLRKNDHQVYALEIALNVKNCVRVMVWRC